jgi:hypothetical protein
MLRAVGMFGLGGIFLAISPKFRMSVYGGLESGVNSMEANAPYSYVGAGVAVLIIAGITLYRGAQAR